MFPRTVARKKLRPEEWRGAHALFADPEHEGDTVRRYLLPIAAFALLAVVAALAGVGPYWP